MRPSPTLAEYQRCEQAQHGVGDRDADGREREARATSVSFLEPTASSSRARNRNAGITPIAAAEHDGDEEADRARRGTGRVRPSTRRMQGALDLLAAQRVGVAAEAHQGLVHLHAGGSTLGAGEPVPSTSSSGRAGCGAPWRRARGGARAGCAGARAASRCAARPASVSASVFTRRSFGAVRRSTKPRASSRSASQVTFDASHRSSLASAPMRLGLVGRRAPRAPASRPGSGRGFGRPRSRNP